MLRFPVTCGAGVVFRDIISSGETIPVWVIVFEPVCPVLGLPVGLVRTLCGRCAVSHFFNNFQEHGIFPLGLFDFPRVGIAHKYMWP